MTNWFCIEVKTGGTPVRKLVIADNVKNENGQCLVDPRIGERVMANNVEGALIASSIFGITPIDVFDEIVTSIDDLNVFLSENNCPKYSSYNGCLIKCFILLCKLTRQSVDNMITEHDAVELYTNSSDIQNTDCGDLQDDEVMVIDYENFDNDLYPSDIELEVVESNNPMCLRTSMIARSSKSMNNSTSRKSKFESRGELVSDEEGEFECEICGDKYNLRSKLKRHLESNKVWNGGQCFRCKKCKKGFHTETALNKHVPATHPELLYDKGPALTLEIRGEVKWKCSNDSCNRIFDQNLSAQIHEVMTHRDFSNCSTEYECSQCSDVFENTQQLSLHSQLAHKPIDNTSISDVIADNTQSDSFANSGLAVRGEKDRERRLEPCKQCDKKCRNYWELAIHTRQVHTTDIPTPEKKTYISMKYGKYIYHYHKDWLKK